jgi:protein SCO1
VTTAQSTANEAPPEPAPRRGPGPIMLTVLALCVIAAGTLLAVALHHRAATSPNSDIRLTGIPASVPTNLADVMALSPTAAHRAPDFTLTDQRGHRMSLSDFRGRVVVLEFMDPHCTDICPLVAREFVNAYHDLGAKASKVAFVAVNVNQYYASPAYMARFSSEHQLSSIPSWHFFTGATSALRAVWNNYGVAVEAPNPNADIVHTSVVYFIDPTGHERFVAEPQVDHTAKGKAYLPAATLAQWGQGISLVASSLTG